MVDVAQTAVEVITGKRAQIDFSALTVEEWAKIVHHAVTILTPEHLMGRTSVERILRGQERLAGDPLEDKVTYHVNDRKFSMLAAPVRINTGVILCGILKPRPSWARWPTREVPIEGVLTNHFTRVTEKMLLAILNGRSVEFYVLSVRWMLTEEWAGLPENPRILQRYLTGGGVTCVKTTLEEALGGYNDSLEAFVHRMLYQFLFAQQTAERKAFMHHRYVKERAESLEALIHRL